MRVNPRVIWGVSPRVIARVNVGVIGTLTAGVTGRVDWGPAVHVFAELVGVEAFVFGVVVVEAPEFGGDVVVEEWGCDGCAGSGDGGAEVVLLDGVVVAVEAADEALFGVVVDDEVVVGFELVGCGFDGLAVPGFGEGGEFGGAPVEDAGEGEGGVGECGEVEELGGDAEGAPVGVGPDCVLDCGVVACHVAASW
ncbi:hypothetical protein PQI66_10005 [Corynebacterium sp. USCH3]|uniref:hypothetical protein n=1 Tax=Corynebacterium sp. USCH3 TaxID=3024840 RepID=UPI0030B6201C